METCEYGILRDKMLSDRLVVRIQDVTLSECLQMDPNLTLERVKKAVQQKEAVKEQHLQLQGEGTKKDPIVLEEVKGRQWPPKRERARPKAYTHGAAAKLQCKGSS